MPRISKLEIQQRDPERVSVFIDGEFAFGASRSGGSASPGTGDRS